MDIKDAINYRESVVNLLKAERLPADDMPAQLDNFLVAIQHDEVIGTAGLETYGNYGLLRSVAVRSDSRNKGVAGELLKQIETLAAAKFLKEIYLLTETAPDYFEHKNYMKITRADVPEEVQRSSEFSHVCPQSAIVMKKLL
jgi:amino-acid N-acetyltransferase